MKLLLKLDLIKPIKSSKKITSKAKIIHTLVGLTLLISFQFIPYFGLFFLERVSHLNLVLSGQRNMIALARNASMVSPFITTLFTGSNDQKESYQRAIRNLTIVIGGLVRNVVIMNYVNPNDHLFLYANTKFITLCYIVQTLIASYAVISLEGYLKTYGIGGQNLMIYYQLLELIYQIHVNPYPGNFGAFNILVGVLVVSFHFFTDYFYEKGLVLKHVSYKGVEKNYKYTPSSLISSAAMAHNLVKQIASNSVYLLINPILAYSGRKLIPVWVTENSFFEENYWICFYIGFNSKIILQWLADMILRLTLLRFASVYDPTYSASLMDQNLKENGLYVQSPYSSLSKIKETIDEIKLNSYFIYFTETGLFSFLPFYGVIIRPQHISYYYGRFTSITTLVKEQPQLPQMLKKIKHKL